MIHFEEDAYSPDKNCFYIEDFKHPNDPFPSSKSIILWEYWLTNWRNNLITVQYF